MLQRLITRIDQPETPPPWGLGIALASLIAAFGALILGVGITTTVLTNGSLPVTLLAGWSIGSGLILAFVWFTRRKPEERAALRLGSLPVASLFMVLLVGLGLAITLDVVSFRVNGQFVADVELASLYGVPIPLAAGLAAALFMVVMQPAAEEVIFRGVIFPALRKASGVWLGLAINALLYAVFHLLAYLPQGAPDDASMWYGFVVPLVGGLFFSAVRAYTGSTRAAIAAHAAFGLFALVKAITLAG